jgi:pyrroline-5-carboxylate reductase
MTTNHNGSHGSGLRKKTIAVLGAGKMGTALITALRNDSASQDLDIRATVKHAERAGDLTQDLGVPVSTDNLAAVREADLVLICVKPQYVATLVHEIASEVPKDALLVSIATAVTTDAIEASLGREVAVVRAMPNSASRIGHGMTALCRGRHASADDLAQAAALFKLMGRTAEVDEAHMDAVTGLSASGPAFIYTIIEALAEGGVRIGLPRELATTLAAQATLGAASMVLHTGMHPAVLKNEVTTPGGCTVEGLLELESGNIRATLIRAVDITARKASGLAGSQKDRTAKASA